MIALIDGDILAYRCAFAAEKTKYLTYSDSSVNLYDAHKDIPKGTPKECVWSRKEVEPEELAVEATQATLQSILKELGTDNVEIFLSGQNSFRERVATTRKYKGNRDAQVRPVHYNAVRETLLGVGARVCEDDMEADDLLGIRATDLGDQCVVVSIDKDLLQIPGRHYNWVQREYIHISTSEGALNLGCQILSGDTTDNVPGLPGIGEGKARKHLGSSNGIRDMVARIRQLYQDTCRENGIQDPDGYLKEMTQLVYILREGRKTEGLEWLEKYAA